MGYWPGPNYALDDFNLRDRLKEIIREHEIVCVVETGLNDGQSTLEFTKMVPFVHGIDHDPKCIEVTANRLAGRLNARLWLGHSPEVLARLMSGLPNNTIFFIDAHWDGECPTLDEIRAITPGKGILVFHDFQVPGHEHDFGWDHMQVGGVQYEMNEAFIRPELLKWSPTYRIEYAKAVSGSKRGFCFVFPS
jgi:hypothetical protein